MNLKVRQTITYGLSISKIVTYAAQYYGESINDIVQLKKGSNSQSNTRYMAIYLGQELGDHKLKAIGKYFCFGHSGSVSYVTSTMRHKVSTEIALKLDVVKVIYYV